MARAYGVKSIIGDSACPSCRAKGGDRTGNHLQHWENSETQEKWVHCSKCGHYEKIDAGNQDHWSGQRRAVVEKSPEEIQALLNEVGEYPIKELKSRGIKSHVAERFGVRVGLSHTDGETPISHYYPKTVDGVITGYKVRNLEHKSFWSVGKGRNCEFFGINQARMGDVWSGRLYIFEDELSAMSGYQALTDASKSLSKPACVSLPDGSGSAAQSITRNDKFLSRFQEIVVCMDNDDAGEEAYKKIRSMLPKVLVARIPGGKTPCGKMIKDANDLVMGGRSVELNNILRFQPVKESPAGAATVLECLEDALKEPEMGLSWPWEEMTKLTFGLRLGEMIAVGGGVGTGKTLIAHEMAAHLINVHKKKVGVFMLEETVGNTLKNIAGKSANTPFHRPDLRFDPERLKTEVLKYQDNLFLYRNFGQNDWEDIKRCFRFWVVENGVEYIFLDNITVMVSHLSSSEINTEVAKVAMELAGLCNELNVTCFIFSHLNPPKTGKPHEEGGQVQEVQFTGSRGLMRFAQLIIGFERNKQADDDNDKSLSMIRVLKDRNFGRTGIVPTIYYPETGRLSTRPNDKWNPEDPFCNPNKTGPVVQQEDPNISESEDFLPEEGSSEEVMNA